MAGQAHTVFLCGIGSEPPMEKVIKALNEINARFIFFNQRTFINASINLEVGPGGLAGEITLNGHLVKFEEISSVYTRLIDFISLPEIVRLPTSHADYIHCEKFHQILEQFIELSPGMVVNRTQAMLSNNSKPYQMQIIRKYFYTPETLITNQLEKVEGFLEEHGNIIFKSMSGVRSIVTDWSDECLDRGQDLELCPVMFQEKVEGFDVRVHVIGDKVFATQVESDSTDYRYGHHQGQEARLSAVLLPEEIEAACVQVSADLELHFSGIDLRITPEGKCYCFEANPCPAFSYYEDHTGQPIARELALFLSSQPSP